MIGRSRTWSLVDELGRAIAAGRFAPDKPFPIEQDLALAYGVSRGGVREAVKVLTSKGLLASKPRVGIRVRPAAEWNLVDPDLAGWLSDAGQDPGMVRELRDFARGVLAEAAAAAAASGARIAPDPDGAAAGPFAPRDAPLPHPVEPLVRAVLAASGNRFHQQMAGLVAAAARRSPPPAPRLLEALTDAVARGDADRARAAAAALLADEVPSARTRSVGDR